MENLALEMIFNRNYRRIIQDEIIYKIKIFLLSLINRLDTKIIHTK